MAPLRPLVSGLGAVSAGVGRVPLWDAVAHGKVCTGPVRRFAFSSATGEVPPEAVARLAVPAHPSLTARSAGRRARAGWCSARRSGSAVVCARSHWSRSMASDAWPTGHDRDPRSPSQPRPQRLPERRPTGAHRSPDRSVPCGRRGRPGTARSRPRCPGGCTSLGPYVSFTGTRRAGTWNSSSVTWARWVGSSRPCRLPPSVYDNTHSRGRHRRNWATRSPSR